MRQQNASDIQEVINHIQSLNRIRDLKVEEFADEGGLADRVVRAIHTDKLKPTQLRKVFHTLKIIQQRVQREAPTEPFDITELLKLMPVLAYAVGRELIPREFYQLLREVFHRNKLQTNEDFLRAFDFVEAILAYHKYRS